MTDLHASGSQGADHTSCSCQTFTGCTVATTVKSRFSSIYPANPAFSSVASHEQEAQCVFFAKQNG